MKRDPYFDNAKFILIALVVLGHVTGPIANNTPVYKVINMVIYLFHMPLFAFISGYFAKTGQIKKNTIRCLLPYIITTFAYWLLFNESNLITALLSPQNALWFLMSLYSWHLLLPLFSRFKYPVLVTIPLSLIAGFFPGIGMFLSLSRTIVFLPFFLAGHYLKKEGLALPENKPVYMFLFLALPIIAIALTTQLNTSNLHFSASYNSWYDFMLRIVLYSIGSLLAFNFLAHIPKRKTFYTSFGESTFFVFITHEIFINIAKLHGIYKTTDYLIYLIPFAILITITLSIPPLASKQLTRKYSWRFGSLP